MPEVYSDHVLTSTGVHGYPHHWNRAAQQATSLRASSSVKRTCHAPAPNRLICARATGELAHHHADTHSALVARRNLDTYKCVAQRNKTEQAAIPGRTANGTAARGQARRNRHTAADTQAADESLGPQVAT
jgi:hypothetical protein